ncbi:MAG: signal peptidase I [Thermoanaerobaculia bacterium]
MSQAGHAAVSLARAAIIALLFALFVRAFLLEVVSIPSDSMVPTLEPGDQLLVNRFVFSGTSAGLLPRRAIRKGDIVLFRPSFDPRQKYVKRCVGRAGDWFGGGILPPGALWLEGDAREQSRDSRSFGAIPESAVFGRAVAILWSRASNDGSQRRILRQVR